MRFWVAVFALLMVLVAQAPRPAFADDDANRSAAAKAFAAGQDADKKGDYRRAIEHYLRAYERKPHHFALYNIGIDYERLGQYREAAAWFERYKREAPASPELDRVERLLVELKLRPSVLTVKTNVPGVRVFVDTRYAGSTPFAKPVRGGQRRITVELNGQKDERDVYLEYGEPKEIEFALRTVAPSAGPTGTLEITGAPDGATISVDDQVVGTLPNVRVDVIPGQHTVTATRYGYQATTVTTAVEANSVTPVPILMVREGEAGPPTDPAKVVVLGYMIGIGGGADASGSGGVYLVDFGVRASRYDLSLRYGKLGELYAFDLLFRAALFDRTLSPYIGGGVSYIGLGSSSSSSSSSAGGGGLEVVGGVRYDVNRSTIGTASILVEVGARFHGDIETMMETRSGLVFPLIASFQYTYGRRR